MKGAVFAIAASGLLGSAIAGHHNHIGLHEKRAAKLVLTASESTCGCTTYTTTFYGEPTLIQPHYYHNATVTKTLTSSSIATSSSSSSTPCTTSTTSSAPAIIPQAYTSSPPVYAAPSSSAAPATPSKPAGGYSSSAGGIIPANGQQGCLTYTPYTPGGQCKSSSEVMSDIKSIAAKGFTTVRMYAPDCSGLQNIGAACEAAGIKMIVGVYIDGSGIDKAREQVSQIVAWGKWNLVPLVVVGNEAVFNKFCSAEQLAAFIQEVRGTLRSAGYQGPVTTTEPVDVFQASAYCLCSAVDVPAANIHPFFDGGVSASQAGQFVANQLGMVAAACGKPVSEAYCLETGWPTAGDVNNKAVPGFAEQKVAIDSIMNALGNHAVVFSYENDDWKQGGAFNVEQHWGCSQLFG